MLSGSASDYWLIFTVVLVVLTIVGSLAVLILNSILGIKHAVHAIFIKFKGLFASSPNQGDGNGTA